MHSDGSPAEIGDGAWSIDDSRSPSISQEHSWFAVAAEPPLATELHYYRVPRDDWELMLARLRQRDRSSLLCAAPWKACHVALDMI